MTQLDHVLNKPGSLFGIDVIISEDRPKYKLPADLPLPPKFRAEFNAWAREFFGMTSMIPDGEVIMMPSDKKAVMNPRTFAVLKSKLDRVIFPPETLDVFRV